MKLIFLTGDIPWPPFTGAKLRTYNLLRHLSTEHEIILITMLTSRDDQPRVDHMKSLGTRVEHIWKPPQPGWSFATGIAKNLASPNPFIVDKHYCQPYVDLVRSVVAREKVDLIHCDSISLALGIWDIESVPTLLTEHNMEAIIWRRYYEEERNPLKRWYIKMQAERVHSFEQRACKQFDLIVAVSDDDKRRLETEYQADNVVVVPNGVDTEYFTSAAIPEEPNRLVFTGSMDWRPNQDALLYFYREIWPLIVAEKPNTELWLVGRRPPSSLTALARADRRIHVTGQVDDVRPYIDAAPVYIVPLRIGGGSRLKILEALSMKKAIVSTSIGAEGLHVEHDRHLILADTPQAFAAQALRLLDDPTTRRRLGETGRAMVIKDYDWERIAQIQVQAWQQAVRAGGKR